MFVPAAVTLTSYAKYTAATCPYRAQPNECECWNNNDALDFGAYPGPSASVTWREFHGADYGKWCAAWEDGKTTPDTTSAVVQNYRNGAHTSTKKCDEHWPNRNASLPNYYDFNVSQSWCWWVVKCASSNSKSQILTIPHAHTQTHALTHARAHTHTLSRSDAWCYVDRKKCTDEVAKKYGIRVERSWTGADIYYSYGVCADWRTRPTKPKDEMPGIAADLSQFSCGTCPFVKGGAQDLQCTAEIGGNVWSVQEVQGAAAYLSTCLLTEYSMLIAEISPTGEFLPSLCVLAAWIYSRYYSLENLELIQPMVPGVSASTAPTLGKAPAGECGTEAAIGSRSDATAASITPAFLRGLAILSTSMYCLLSLALH